MAIELDGGFRHSGIEHHLAVDFSFGFSQPHGFDGLKQQVGKEHEGGQAVVVGLGRCERTRISPLTKHNHRVGRHPSVIHDPDIGSGVEEVNTESKVVSKEQRAENNDAKDHQELNETGGLGER